MAVRHDGRPARTHFATDARYEAPDTALLTCRLETGRTHQIRVHLASIGHPVAGDVRYGRRTAIEGLDRPFLHATELAFAHPATGEELVVRAPLPADLEDVLAGLTERP